MLKKKSSRKKDLKEKDIFSSEFKFSADFDTKTSQTPRHPISEFRSEYVIASLFNSSFEFEDGPFSSDLLQQFRTQLVNFQTNEEQLKNIFSQIYSNDSEIPTIPNFENLKLLDVKTVTTKRTIEKTQEMNQSQTQLVIHEAKMATPAAQQRKYSVPAAKTKTKNQIKQTLELSEELKMQLTQIQTQTPTEEAKQQKLFKFTPESVSFTDFVPGKWMEATVEIKNISGAGTRVTISPPNTKNFQVRNIEYPTEGSLVASGLNVKVTIRFLPDQLRDFSDVLVVRGTTGYMTLSLSGKRTPPNLEVPQVINCGDCLVGNSKSIKLVCRNKGGQGECKVILDNSSSSIYSVTPKEFSLEAGQDIELRVTFAPRQERIYSNTVTFQYDTHEENYSIEGKGNFPNFTVSSVNENHLDFRTPSVEVEFGESPVSCGIQKKVGIANLSGVAVTFRWEFYRPSRESSIVKKEFHKTDICEFTISPSSGNIRAEEVLGFEVDFTPTQAGLNEIIARFVVENVPQVSPDVIAADGVPTSYETSRGTIDLHCINLQLSGFGSRPTVVLQPPVILMKSIVVGQTTTRKFKLFNPSPSELQFEWKTEDGPSVFSKVTPREGILSSQGFENCELVISPKIVGKFSFALECKTEERVVSLLVQGQAQEMQLEIDKTFIDFQVFQTNKQFSREFQLSNQTKFETTWFLAPEKKLPESLDLKISPSHGIIRPGETITVTISVEVSIPLKFKVGIVLHSNKEPVQTCYILGESMAAKIKASPEWVDLHTVLLQQISQFKVDLENPCPFPISYYWQCDTTGVLVSQNIGELAPHSSNQHSFTLITTSPGLIEGHLLCRTSEREGVDIPLKAKVEELSLLFNLSNHFPANLDQLKFVETLESIDFGILPIFTFKTIFITIKNTSSVVCSGISFSTKNISIFRVASTPLGSGRLTSHDKNYLKDKKGASFLTSVDADYLAPLGHIKIAIACINNMCGQYEDLIEVKLMNRIVKIPVKALITGSPLTILPNSNGVTIEESTPTIRFVFSSSLSVPLRKTLRIINESCTDVALSWRVFKKQRESLFEDNSDVFMVIPKENTIFSGQSSEFEVKFTSTTPENDYVLIGEQSASKNTQNTLPNILVNLIVSQR